MLSLGKNQSVCRDMFAVPVSRCDLFFWNEFLLPHAFVIDPHKYNIMCMASC